MSPDIARMKRDNERYRKANPWYLHNCSSVGTAYGRYATLGEAVAAIESRSGAKYIGIDGKAVLFTEPVYC